MTDRQCLFMQAPLDYLVKLRPKEAHRLLARIKLLTADPVPDGKTKKQVRHMKGKRYYARSGRHRIIYTFGRQSIHLLDIRLRDDDTYNTGVDDVDDEIILEDVDDQD